MKQKHGSVNYVPVTMDELMMRFVLNLHRNEHLDTYTSSRKILDKKDLRLEEEEEIKDGVANSMNAL